MNVETCGDRSQLGCTECGYVCNLLILRRSFLDCIIYFIHCLCVRVITQIKGGSHLNFFVTSDPLIYK